MFYPITSPSNSTNHAINIYIQLTHNLHPINSSDGPVVKASASELVDVGFIPSQVKPMTLKLVFTATLLDAQH